MKYKLVFSRSALRDDKYVHCLLDQEWSHIDTLSKCLKHLYEAANLLSVIKYLKCNFLFEEFCEIQLLLIEWQKSSDDTIVAMAFEMKMKFGKYWDMSNKIVAVATFLDPRCSQLLICLI